MEFSLFLLITLPIITCISYAGYCVFYKKKAHTDFDIIMISCSIILCIIVLMFTIEFAFVSTPNIIVMDP